MTVAAGMAGESVQNPFFALMTKAAAHARAHHARYTPALSPMKESLLGEEPAIDVEQMHSAGFLVVPWTVDDVPTMRLLMAKHVDGIISDRPDLLMAEVRAARARAKGDAAELRYLDAFDAQGHRGGRGLRPENTLRDRDPRRARRNSVRLCAPHKRRGLNISSRCRCFTCISQRAQHLGQHLSPLRVPCLFNHDRALPRSEEHTSELQSP